MCLGLRDIFQNGCLSPRGLHKTLCFLPKSRVLTSVGLRRAVHLTKGNVETRGHPRTTSLPEGSNRDRQGLSVPLPVVSGNPDHSAGSVTHVFARKDVRGTTRGIMTPFKSRGKHLLGRTLTGWQLWGCMAKGPYVNMTVKLAHQTKVLPQHPGPLVG